VACEGRGEERRGEERRGEERCTLKFGSKILGKETT
jgi:hypothetical protein